jgi:hypothetical protein
MATIMGVIGKTNALPKGAETTKQRIAKGLAAALIAGGLIGSAPPASAGCIYGGFSAKSRCDGPCPA